LKHPQQVVNNDILKMRSAWVYTDGACSGNGYKGARAGKVLCFLTNLFINSFIDSLISFPGVGVYWGNQRPYNISARLSGRQTNNSAELGAVVIALRQAIEENYDRLTIYTDSQFIIDCIYDYVPRWSKNGWRRTNGKPVVNRCEFKCILRLMDRISDVRFRKVDAHSGNFGNEEADRFAREGCQKDCDAHSEYDYVHSDDESDC